MKTVFQFADRWVEDVRNSSGIDRVALDHLVLQSADKSQRIAYRKNDQGQLARFRELNNQWVQDAYIKDNVAIEFKELKDSSVPTGNKQLLQFRLVVSVDSGPNRPNNIYKIGITVRVLSSFLYPAF